MDYILLARETLVTFYKRFEYIFIFAFKLLMGLILFRFINMIGLYRPEFAVLFKPPLDFPYMALCVLLFALTPPSIAYTLLMVQLCIQISQSLVITAYIFLILALIIVFYARLSPKKSFLILAVIIGFYLKIPYAVIIFAGLYFGLTSIIPVIIGVFLWNFAPFFHTLLLNEEPMAKLDYVALPGLFLEAVNKIINAITTDLSWIFTAFSFAMVILTVYAISRLSIKYAKDCAIVLGGIINLICHIIAIVVLKMEVSFLSVLFFTVLSVVIMEFVRFLDIVLDYNRAENVQFEDEDNYYYVKVIPKVIASPKKRK